MYGIDCGPGCSCDDCMEQQQAALGEIDWSHLIDQVGNVTTRIITAINPPSQLPAYTPPYQSARTAPIYQQPGYSQPGGYPQVVTAGPSMTSMLPWAGLALGLLALSRRR